MTTPITITIIAKQWPGQTNHHVECERCGLVRMQANYSDAFRARQDHYQAVHTGEVIRLGYRSETYSATTYTTEVTK